VYGNVPMALFGRVVCRRWSGPGAVRAERTTTLASASSPSQFQVSAASAARGADRRPQIGSMLAIRKGEEKPNFSIQRSKDVTERTIDLRLPFILNPQPHVIIMRNSAIRTASALQHLRPSPDLTL